MSKINSITSIINITSAPIGRLLISFMFLMSGLNKVGNDVQCRCGDPDNDNDDAFLNEKYINPLST